MRILMIFLLWAAIALCGTVSATSCHDASQFVTSSEIFLGSSRSNLNQPRAVWIDSTGIIFVLDAGTHQVHKVDEFNIITIFAGVKGTAGYGGDGENADAVNVLFDSPSDITGDSTGNLFIADFENNRVRKIERSSNIITTFAGTGSSKNVEFISDIAATSSDINYPRTVAFDEAGNYLFIGEFGARRITRVDSAGILTLFAGGGLNSVPQHGTFAYDVNIGNPIDLWVDQTSGDVFIASHIVFKVAASDGLAYSIAGGIASVSSGNGGPVSLATFRSIAGITGDTVGNLFVSDKIAGQVRRICLDSGIIFGFIDTAQTQEIEQAFYNPLDESLYHVDGKEFVVRRVGIKSKVNRRLTSTQCLTGLNLETSSATIVGTYDTQGTTASVASEGGIAATSATLNKPVAIWIDSVGIMFLVDNNLHIIRRVSVGGIITLFAGVPGSGAYGGDEGPADSTNVKFFYPYDITGDTNGNIYIADNFNHRIRKITRRTNIIQNYAGTGTPGALGVGNQAASAQISGPNGVALDIADNILYIADWNNNRVAKVAANGILTTFAGMVSGIADPNGITALAALIGNTVALWVDQSNGNVFIASYSQRQIFKVDKSTDLIYTIAGGTSGVESLGDGGDATSARFESLIGVTGDTSGSLYISDKEAGLIRRICLDSGIIYGFITSSGDVLKSHFSTYDNNLYFGDDTHEVVKKITMEYHNPSFAPTTAPTYGSCHDIAVSFESVAGTTVGTSGSTAADGAVATLTLLDDPVAIWIDSTGVIFFTEFGTHKLRAIVNGVVTTIAGDGSPSFGGDGTAVPSLSVQLNLPAGLAGDSNGNIYIADSGNNRIRKIDAASDIISTIAGGGSTAPGDFATEVALSYPAVLALREAYDVLYIVELIGGRVTKLDLSTGILSLFAGDGSALNAINNGINALDAALPSLVGLWVDQVSGVVYIATQYTVHKVNGDGFIYHVAGSLLDVGGTSSGDNGPATSAVFTLIVGIGGDTSGNLYISDRLAGNMRRVCINSGIIDTIIEGTDGSFPEVPFFNEADNSLYFADLSYDTLTKASLSVLAPSLAPSLAPTLGVCYDDSEDVMTTATYAGTMSSFGHTGDGGLATSGTLTQPVGVWIDSTDSMFILDQGNFVVRRIDGSTGIIDTFAGSGGNGFGGDGGLATAPSVGFTLLTAITGDSIGNIFVVDQNNYRIRRVNSDTNILDTYAGDGSASTHSIGGLAINAGLYLITGLDYDTTRNRLYAGSILSCAVWAIDARTGIITKYAGSGICGDSGVDGSATSINLGQVGDVWVEQHSGKLFLVDQLRVRQVDLDKQLTTIAGSGSGLSDGDGGLALDAGFRDLNSITGDTLGNLYVTEEQDPGKLRRICLSGGMVYIFLQTSYTYGKGTIHNGNYYYSSYQHHFIAEVTYYFLASPSFAPTLFPTTGLYDTCYNIADTTVTSKVVAGTTGVSGYTGDGNDATLAAISFPMSVWIDSNGVMYISDKLLHRIRKVDMDGIITTFAGAGGVGAFAGDGFEASASNVRFNENIGITGGSNGNIFIADSKNNRIRRIDGATTIVSTFAGDGAPNYGGDGQSALLASLNNPQDVVLDEANTILYFTELQNHVVRKVDSNGIISTLAGTGTLGNSGDNILAATALLGHLTGLWFDPSNGNVFVADYSNSKVWKIDADTYISTFTELPLATNTRSGLTGDSAGSLYLTLQSAGGGAVYRICQATTIAEVFIDKAPSSAFASPYFHSDGKLYIPDVAQFHVTQYTIAYPYGACYSPLVDAGIQASVIAGIDGEANTFTPNVQATASNLLNPIAVWADTSGSIYIVDVDANAIFLVDSTGIISLFAGANPSGAFGGDGSPASSNSVEFSGPFDISGDSEGSIYIADVNNNRVRKIDGFGSRTVSTFAGDGSSGGGNRDDVLAVNGKLFGLRGVYWDDATTNLYIAEFAGAAIRKVDSDGIMSYVVGGLGVGSSADGVAAVDASVGKTPDVWFDPIHRSVYFSDQTNKKVWKVDSEGILSTFAGGNGATSGGDDGPATSASFSSTQGVGGDSIGNVYIAEPTASKLRKVCIASGIIEEVYSGIAVTKFFLFSDTELFLAEPGRAIILRASIEYPTESPTSLPTTQPSTIPSIQPSSSPSHQPITIPTSLPSTQPSSQPTFFPSMQPAGVPTSLPSTRPSTLPTMQPSSSPSVQPSSVPSTQPTSFPSTQPTVLPTIQPSSGPSSQPSAAPSTQPTRVPTTQPSRLPSVQPSVIPTIQPSRAPSVQPSNNPSSHPTNQPTSQPSINPTQQPSCLPSCQPSSLPSGQPSDQPTTQPSMNPTQQPSSLPSCQPSSIPSMQPSEQPSSLPSSQPTSPPRGQPSIQPTAQPSMNPTRQPSSIPSSQPTRYPTNQPSACPTSQPSSLPSAQPTMIPTAQPSGHPSGYPTMQPSSQPSCQPSAVPSMIPSSQPSSQPSTLPSVQPSTQPLVAPSMQPTGVPTQQPSSAPSMQPSSSPTIQPSTQPSSQPSVQPSSLPSVQPSALPSMQPSEYPSTQPTCQPTSSPSSQPTSQPSSLPSMQPSGIPSTQPSSQPSHQPSSQPTEQPSRQPSAVPTAQPTVQPSGDPTAQPSNQPTVQPSSVPTMQPTSHPSMQPSAQPTNSPTGDPTSQPTSQPSAQPSRVPSQQPYSHPTTQPTSKPSVLPTSTPSCQPSVTPTSQPRSRPTCQPSNQPTSIPSLQPTSLPTIQPTAQPSILPSCQPTGIPSSLPSAEPTFVPTNQPTGRPSVSPLSSPSSQPSSVPTIVPSTQPTSSPTQQPSDLPSSPPSSAPSIQPSVQPTALPTSIPTSMPTAFNLGSRPTPVPTLPPLVQIDRIKVMNSALNPSTALVVNVSLSNKDDAFVYCGAFFESDPGSVYVVKQQGVSAVSTDSSAIMSISGLAAARSYSVYCFTESFLGRTMTTAEMLSTRAIATTACCRSIFFDLQVQSLFLGQSVVDAIEIYLDTVPDEKITVTLMWSSNGSFFDGINVFPSSSFTISNSSEVQDYYFSLAALSKPPSSAVQLSLALSGPSAAQYEVVAVGSELLSILSADEEPATPQLQSASFSSDGSYIVVTFDTATNRAGYVVSFDCAATFDFEQLSSFSCQWQSSRIVHFYRRATARSILDLEIGSSISITAGNKLKAACTKSADVCVDWSTVAASSVQLSAPSNPDAPSVVLQLPSKIGECTSIAIDLSVSSGSGGRAWTSSLVTAVSTPSFSVDIEPLVQYLSMQKNNFTADEPVEIDSSLLEAGVTYTFTATLCNFLGACSSKSRSVSVISSVDAVPVVQIAGAQQRSITTSAGVYLSSTAYTVDCNGTFDSSELSYEWLVLEDGDLRTDLISSSRDASKFRLAPYSLQPLRSYDIQLTVSRSGSSQRSEAVVTLIISQAPLVAVIAGGAERYVPAGSTVTLDGSLSRDLDDNSGTGSSLTQLRFAWTCVQTLPTLQTSCPFQIISRTDLELLVLALDSTSTNTTAELSLRVYDATRSSSSSVTVHAVAASAPVVAITTAANAVSYIQVNRRLQLSGTVTTDAASCEAKWFVNEPSLLLADIATSSISTAVPKGSSRVVNLVISANLLPPRASLTFSLLCGSAAASIDIDTNGSPLPGKFSVLPRSGTALSTLFTFTASSWSDEDLPLSYQYQFKKVGTDNALVVKSRSEGSISTTTLPAGIKSYGMEIRCIVKVFDSFYATVESTIVVTVDEAKDSAAAQANILNLLASTGANLEAKKNILAVASSDVNAVNCTLSPDCSAALNRATCGEVEHSCGACLDGFVGDVGPSNSQCVLYSDADADAGNSSTLGAACTSQSDCSGWESCLTSSADADADAVVELAAKVCSIPSKACPGDGQCSGKGECIFINSNTRQSASTCLIDDSTCQAQCKCSDGFSGPSCSQTAAQLAQQRAVRDGLISSLANVIETDDVNEETVAVWVDTLAALTQKPLEVSITSVSMIHVILDAVLANAVALEDISYDVLVGLLDVLNGAMTIVADSGLSGDEIIALTGKNIKLLSLFNDFIAGEIVSGQNSVEFVKDNFRSNVLLQFYERNGSVDIKAPKTTAELLLKSLSPAVSWKAGKEADFVTTVLSLASSAFSHIDSLASNALNMKVSATDQSAIGKISIVLIHNAAMSFGSGAYSEKELVFNTTCDGSDSKESNAVHTHLCPGSGVELRHVCEPGSDPMLLSSRCPVLMPSCKLLNVSTGVVNNTVDPCQVVAYDAFSTTCECATEDLSTIAASAATRRLLRQLSGSEDDAAAETVVLDVVGISEYVGTEFVQNLLVAEDAKFDSAADFQRVLYSILMFVVLWGGGFAVIFGCAWRQQRATKQLDSKYADKRRATVSGQAAISAQDAYKYLNSYVDEVFPSVFSDKPLLGRVVDELKRHHRYFTLAAGTAGTSVNKAHIVTGAQLLSVQTVLIFLLAWLYDVQWSADDGSCETFTTEERCLQDKTPLDSAQTLCSWVRNPNPNVDDDGRAYICEYEEAAFSFKAQIYLAVLVALMTAVFMYPVDAMFDLLSAPTADDIKVAASDQNAMREMRRRVSNAARRVSNVVGSAVSTARMTLAGRKSVVGEAARKIPKSAEHAHAIATVSTQSLLEPARSKIRQQQLERLRLYHQSSHRLESFDAASSDDSDGSDDEGSGVQHGDAASEASSSSSDESGESERRVKGSGAARGAEATDVVAQPHRGGFFATLSKWFTLSRRRAAVDGKTSSSTKKVSPAVEQGMDHLTEQVQSQRMMLQPSEIEFFDLQWGLDPNGEFTRSTYRRLSLLAPMRQRGSAEIIGKELGVVAAEAQKKASKLQLATDAHIGLEILHLFVIDLLGRYTPAARIFEKKSAEDFQHTKVVTRRAKVLAVCLLVGLNFFFVYFTILVSYSRGSRWQRGFVAACIVQLLVEVFLFETMECLWVNCVIPATVSSQVRSAGDAVRRAVASLLTEAEDSAGRLFLSAPDFLFISTNLAKRFPQLMESVLVQSYYSHLPGELSKLWQVGATARIHRYYLLRRTTMLTVLLMAVQQLATTPFVLQRVLVRLVQPFAFIALAYLGLFVMSSPIFIALFGFLFLCAAGYCFYFFVYRSRQLEMEKHMTISPSDTTLPSDAKPSTPSVKVELFLNDNSSKSYRHVRELDPNESVIVDCADDKAGLPRTLDGEAKTAEFDEVNRQVAVVAEDKQADDGFSDTDTPLHHEVPYPSLIDDDDDQHADNDDEGSMNSSDLGSVSISISSDSGSEESH